MSNTVWAEFVRIPRGITSRAQICPEIATGIKKYRKIEIKSKKIPGRREMLEKWRDRLVRAFLVDRSQRLDSGDSKSRSRAFTTTRTSSLRVNCRAHGWHGSRCNRLQPLDFFSYGPRLQHVSTRVSGQPDHPLQELLTLDHAPSSADSRTSGARETYRSDWGYVRHSREAFSQISLYLSVFGPASGRFWSKFVRIGERHISVLTGVLPDFDDTYLLLNGVVVA